MRKLIFAIVLSASGVAFGPTILGSGAAYADGGIRCGNELILKGDTRERVRARCGEPADVSKKTILRTSRTALRGRIERVSEETEEIPVETWTYNFGHNRLMERIRFVDGVVEEIDTLGYGYDN